MYMKVLFYLRKDKKNKKNLYPIRLLISFNGEQYYRNVPKVYCSLKDWKEKDQRIKPNLKSEPYNFNLEYNSLIDNIEIKLKELYRYCLLNKIGITKNIIIQKLDGKIDEFESTQDFFQYFDYFLEKNKTTKAERTITGYTTTKNFLMDFETTENYSLDWNSINLLFFEKLEYYAFKKRKISTNYFSKLVSVLKTFMNWGFEKGHHDNIEFKKIKTSEHDIEVIYLTMDELMRLYNFKFDLPKLDRVRDIYCFGCFTGLRYSDIKNLKPSNIKEDHIELTIQKTKTVAHNIPLTKFSKAILEKYIKTPFYPLPVISNQKFNNYLKECAKMAKIDSEIQITRYIGNERIDKIVPKYELITSHTARKTFVTNSLILGVNQMVVRNITGHKKESSFRKYVNIAETHKKSEMEKAWDKL